MNKYIQYIMIAGFCLLVGGPFAGTIAKVGTLTSPEFRSVEMRQRAGFPEWDKVKSVSDWTAKFGQWFDDRYAFRHRLSKAHALIQYRVFGQSAFPNSVIVGKNNFLFLGDGHAQMLSVHAGIPVWSDEALGGLAEKLGSAADWLGTKDIPLLISISPDKATIYVENLPDWIREPNKNLPVARLVKLANARGQTNIHYNPEALLEAKKQYPNVLLYMSGDTHWNGLGAFVYYQDMMHRLETVYGKPLHVLPLPAVTQTMEKGNVERLPLDLESFIKDLRAREVVKLDDSQWPPMPGDQHIDPALLKSVPMEGFAQFVTTDAQALNPQKILLLGDSFSVILRWYFYRSFGSMMYLHSSSSPEVIAEAVKWYEPDMVIFEVVERSALSLFKER